MSRAFVLSGYTCPDTRAYLAQLIIDLHGVYLEPKVLGSNCTHLIATPLARSEKCLSAIATGLWILPEEYILDSHQAGEWLPEERYEWTAESLSSYYEADICTLIRNAASKNRSLVQETKRKLFFGWTCFLCLSDQKKQNVYERILNCGDANVYTIESLRHLTDDALSYITHVFTEAKNVVTIKEILSNPCYFLSVDYLRNYLLREVVPDETEFEIETYSPSLDPLSGMRLKKCRKITRFKSPKLVIHVEKCREMDTKKRFKINTEEKVETNVPPGESSSQGKYYVTTQCHQTLLKKVNDLPKIKILKKRFWDIEIQSAISMCYEHVKGGGEIPSALPDALAEMFQTCVEENNSESAVEFLHNILVPRWFPPPKIITSLFSLILESKNTALHWKAYDGLAMLIRNHPPRSKDISEIYCRAFSTKNNNSQLYRDVLRKCISSKTEENKLFYIFVEILQIDFESFLKRTVNPSKELTEADTRPLVCIVFWPDCKVGSLNNNCRELIELLPDVLKDDDHLEVVQHMFGIVLECVRLSTMSSHDQREQSVYSTYCHKFAVEVLKTCAVVFQENSLVIKFLKSLEPVWFSMLMSELLIQIVPGIGYKKTGEDTLSLGKIVNYYMFPEIMKSPKNLNPELNRIRRIMAQDDSLQPSQKKKAERVNAQNRKGETKLHTACMKPDTKALQSLLNRPGIDVNIKDFAGWTPLHEACNRGYVESVKLLLKWKPHPDFMPKGGHEEKCFVDLFAKSHEDEVTPLHDAVSNNHVEVVKCLLKCGGRKLLGVEDKKGQTPVRLARTPFMLQYLSSYVSDVDEPDNFPSEDDEEEDDSPGLETSKSRNQISEHQCTNFLDYFTCLFNSYLSWNCLEEISEAWGYFGKYYKELRYDLVTDIYKSVHLRTPSDDKVVITLCDDLHILLAFPEHLKKLELHVEKLSRKNKSHFYLALFSLTARDFH